MGICETKAKWGLLKLIGTKQNKKIILFFIFILSLRDQEYYHFFRRY